MDDDFIGSRFGKEGQLEVIGVSGKRRHNKVYAVLCHKCKLDPELFGDGVFHRVKADFIAGNIPCGCSKAVKWSKDQYKILAQRHCDKKSYKFIDFTGDWKGKWTSVQLVCDKGHSIVMSLNNFLYGFNCKTCGIISTAQKCTHDYLEEINSFYDSGKIPAEMIFSKSDRQTKAAHYAYWDYKCPVCSKDDYVNASLCTGIFTSVASSLKKGMLGCRCGVWYKWDQPKREHQFNSRIRKENLDIKFSRWKNDKFGIYGTVWFICGTHGEFKSTVGSFLHAETGCPNCAKSGFNKSKPAIFYILKVEGAYSNFTGYGISGNIDFRLKTHFTTLTNKGYSIVDKYLVNGGGDLMFELEANVKKDFECNPQQVVGFKREATYYENYDKLIEYAVNYTKEKSCQQWNKSTTTSYHS